MYNNTFFEDAKVVLIYIKSKSVNRHVGTCVSIPHNFFIGIKTISMRIVTFDA